MDSPLFPTHKGLSSPLWEVGSPPSPFSSSSFHSHPIPRGGGGEADGAAAEASFLSQPTLLSHIEIRGGQENPQIFCILFFWGKVLACVNDDSTDFFVFLTYKFGESHTNRRRPRWCKVMERERERKRKRSRKLSQQRRERGGYGGEGPLETGGGLTFPWLPAAYRLRLRFP